MRRALVLCALLIGGLLAAPAPLALAADEGLSAGAELAAAPAFTAEDLYYYDDDGMEMPLQVVPGLFVVHVRGGKKPEDIRVVIEEVPQVEAVELRPDRSFFLVRVKESVLDLHYEVERRLAILLQLLNSLNAELAEGGYAAPVARIQGKALALSDTFFAQFKSFVTAQEIERFNAANEVEPLPGREAPDAALCLRVKPSAGRNVLQMLHLYHEEPRVRAARPMFVPIFPPVTARAEIDRSATMLGDEVTYRLVVDRDPNVNVDWGLLAKDTIILFPDGVSSEGLVVTEARDVGPVEREGRVEEVREYTLVFYQIGDFVLPEVRVYCTVGDDPRPLEAHANPVDVHVCSMLSQGMRNINGLPPQAWASPATPPPRRGGVLVLVAVCLIAASGAGAVWRVQVSRRRRAAEALSPEAGRREEALRELELLPERIRAGSSTASPEAADALRLQVNATVRRAVEAVYHVSADGGSTSRLLHELERLCVEEEVIAPVEKLLAAYCDQRFLPPGHRPLPTATDVDALAGAVTRLVAHLRAAARGVVGRAPAVA